MKKLRKIKGIIAHSIFSLRPRGFIALLFLLLLVLSMLSFFAYGDSLARMAAYKYGNRDMALWLNRRDAKLAMFLGNYYFGQTLGKSEYDLTKAKRAFKKAVKITPGILWGHYQLARIAFAESDFTEALREINEELRFNPENLRSLYVRGLIYGYQGDLEKAETDFSRFIAWAPMEWGGYNDLSWILSKRGKDAEAEKVIQQALRKVPDAEKNPWLWNSLGVAQLNLNDYNNAVTSFNKAQTLAENITNRDWRLAYPGNEPNSAADGLLAFRNAIEKNLLHARAQNAK